MNDNTGLRTVIRDLSTKQAFDQKSWVEKDEEHKIEVCSVDSGNGVLIQMNDTHYPLIVPRSNLTGLIEMLMTLSERLEEDQPVIYGT